jgi:alkylated DNA nucleotide flippase Atl1
LLIDADGAWVALPEVLELGIAQYNARVYELRRLGFAIENRTERVNGQRHSWFRLVQSPTQSKSQGCTESDYMKRIREEGAAACPLFAEVRS